MLLCKVKGTLVATQKNEHLRQEKMLICQPVTLDGSIPSAAPSSFCVLTTIVNSNGYDGLAEGSCTAPAPGLYRLSVEMQSNAHVSILKNGPQAVPSSDTRVVRVY